MGRTARFSTDQILDAAGDLLIAGGPARVSVQAVVAATGAPSGSIYHRFAGRDVLAASLWLRAVERFQLGLPAALDEPDGSAAARRAAAHVLRWSRHSPSDARILTMYRSRDLLIGDWPAELAGRDAAQRERVRAFLDELCRRLGATDPAGRQRVRLAVVVIPHAAVRDAFERGVPPEPAVEAAVLAAVDAVLTIPFVRGGHRDERRDD